MVSIQKPNSFAFVYVERTFFYLLLLGVEEKKNFSLYFLKHFINNYFGVKNNPKTLFNAFIGWSGFKAPVQDSFQLPALYFFFCKFSVNFVCIKGIPEAVPDLVSRNKNLCSQSPVVTVIVVQLMLHQFHSGSIKFKSM